MHKPIHEKLNPISPGLLALLGCLTTQFTHASVDISTQPISSSSANDIKELEVTKVEDSMQAADFNTLLPIEIRPDQSSDSRDALRLLLSTRIENTLSYSNQQGDIRPAEFSIRGAVPYQNNIQLDNASIDVLLYPAKKVLLGQIPNRTKTEGYSQAVFIDPRFIGIDEIIGTINHIETTDTKIPVVEGGFTSGVIKAKTRSYSKQNEIGFSRRITKNSWTKSHIDEYLLTELGEWAQRVPGTSGEIHPNCDKSETTISGATRIEDVGVFAGFSEKRSEINQKCTAVLPTLGNLAYFLGTRRFTIINGFQYLDLVDSNEKTRLDTYEVRDQGYPLSWSLSLLYRFETDFGAPYVRSDVINVTNSESVMGFKAGTQLFSIGGQYWAEVGYEF